MRKDVHRNLSLWKYKWVLMKIYLCPNENGGREGIRVLGLQVLGLQALGPTT
jgi:hypothetical protein